MAENLPPNWECKYDLRTQRYYYVNHVTKTTTWEDPRGRYKQIQDGVSNSDQIAMQPMHGSPYHVYPAKNNPPAQAAFQGPASGVPSLSASPQLAARLQQLEMSPVSRASPQTPRSVSQLSRQTVQETSFSTQTQAAIDTEATVAKINTMFPTVPDTHIRMLLKKYYNREAVVISALQVEKHPLTTPGPYATPPPTSRHFYMTSSAIMHMTPLMGARNIGGGDAHYGSRNDSPIMRPASCASGSYYGSPRVGEGFRSSPKPHSSPKMKLRYLKGIFPKAEETLILDILANADNNVQKASEQLLTMGYDKKDTSIQKHALKKKEEENARKVIADKLAQEQPPTIKTNDEKNKLKLRLQSKYSSVAERIISMALESVDYSEEKAAQILSIVVQEDNIQNKENQGTRSNLNEENEATTSRSSSRRSTNVQMHQTSTSSPQRQPTQSVGVADAEETEQPKTVWSSTTSSSHVTVIRDLSSSPGSKKKTQDIGGRGIDDDDGISSECRSKQQNRSKTKIDHTKTATAAQATVVTTKREAKIIEGGVSHVDGVAVKDTMKSEFKTIIHRAAATGQNRELFKGPNDDILLVDYVTWRGANSDLVMGRQKLACGANPANRLDRSYSPCGPNTDLYKGSQKNLAKGSIYSQLNHVKVN